MKIKDMTVGLEVAVSSYHPKDDPAPSGAVIATIVATRQRRRVYSGARWDFGGHSANDGVRVRFTTARPIGDRVRDEPNDSLDRIVGPRDVLSTWADYETASAQKRTVTEAKTTRLRDEMSTCESAVTQLGVGRVESVFSGGQLRGYRVSLTATEAQSLVEA